MSAGSLVREARQRVGLTQQELARRSGTSQPALARLEAGIGSPTLSTLQRLTEAAGLRLEIRLVEPAPAEDALIERYRDGIDRTLLRRNLALSVDQRIRELGRLQRFHAAVGRAVRAARRRSR